MEVAYDFDQELVVVVSSRYYLSVKSLVRNSSYQVESSCVEWILVIKYA